MWGNLNVITNSSGIYTATRVNPGMVGSYYLDLTSRNVPGRGIVSGIVTSGPIDTVTYEPISGFPYNGRPDALKGKWQYMGFGAGDQGFIKVLLTKWNVSTSSRDTIGYIHQVLSGMEMSWTDMYIPITYYQAGAPDTCIIVLSSSGPIPEEESFLYVDELFFDGFVGVEPILEEELNVYPNPAADIMNIEFENSTGDSYTVIIENISGQIVKEIEVSITNIGTNNYNFPTFDIENGTYFLRIELNGKSLNRKININH